MERFFWREKFTDFYEKLKMKFMNSNFEKVFKLWDQVIIIHKMQLVIFLITKLSFSAQDKVGS